jgi:hypothetical protein
MTLLLASVRDEEIILSSDSLSTSQLKRRSNPKQTFPVPGRATLQKIFPIPSREMAVAHCGRNSLLNMSVGAVIREWFQGSLPQSTVDVARSLSSFVLEYSPDYFDADNRFWIAGFDSDGPHVYSVSASVSTETDLACGSGKNYLPDKWQQLQHSEAFEHVLGNKEARQTVGGTLQTLRILRSGCVWLAPPTRGTLGVHEFIGAVRAPTNTPINDPLAAIVLQRETLLREFRERAVIGTKRKRPTGYEGAKEHWAGDTEPNWQLADQVIAIYDEATVARVGDVSVDDALLVEAAVDQILASLPATVPLDRRI